MSDQNRDFFAMLDDLSMTQGEFANLANIDRTTVVRWKKSGVPGLAVLAAQLMVQLRAAARSAGD